MQILDVLELIVVNYFILCDIKRNFNYIYKDVVYDI